MTEIKLYLDEDTVDSRFLLALRARRIPVMTVFEAGLSGRPDDEQLEFATENGYVLFSFNVGDYCRLHSEWIAAGHEHSGIVVAPQQQFSIGELVRRIGLIRADLDGADMRNRIEFLTSWT